MIEEKECISVDVRHTKTNKDFIFARVNREGVEVCFHTDHIHETSKIKIGTEGGCGNLVVLGWVFRNKLLEACCR